MIHYAHRRRRRRRNQAGRGSTRKKTMPIRLMDQSELFVTTKLIAIWFIANLDQLSIFSRIDQKIAWNWTSNRSMPIRVLTHKNSLVSKESYRKVFDCTKKKFNMGAPIGSMSKLKFFFVSQKFSIEWCSHRTFDKKKSLQSHPWKHQGESSENF